VATAVPSATASTERAVITGSISSIAKARPPSGELNVAAMPPPAPAATRTMR
jgi:hypothetical protein